MLKSKVFLIAALCISVTTAGISNSASVEISQNRTYRVVAPANLNSSKGHPVILFLHGYTSSSLAVEKFFGMTNLAKSKGVISVFPEGSTDAWGATFWNATPACCNFFDSTVDDSEYLIDLIEEVSTKYSIDKRRVYLAGHSNGGFMAHRMACDHSDKIAGVISVAGAIFDQIQECKATSPVSVLQVHGIQDQVISYESSLLNGQRYPSAKQSVNAWARIAGCELSPVKLKKKLGLEATSSNLETSAISFSKCKGSAGVQLWSMSGVGHNPKFNKTFSQMALQFLLDHPKKLN